MLNQDHPDDERLSGLASRDDDATADAELTSHVDTCARCTDLVTELGALRMSLADLPDLRPSRPLRLLPPAADEKVAIGASGWIRRVFAPALTAGAALAMVGLIGTATPALDGLAAGGGIFENVGTDLQGAPETGDGDAGEAPAAEVESMRVQASPDGVGAAGGEDSRDTDGSEDGVSRFETFNDQLPAERSPWPMVLFTGVALMVAAGLLRWILVPRAG